jgi:hypothetical protein
MLSSFLFKKPIYINRSLHDYCRKSTEESIRKKTEKYNLERKNQLSNTRFTINNDNNNNNPEFNIYTFLLFLSISSISFYFYKRLQ